MIIHPGVLAYNRGFLLEISENYDQKTNTEQWGLSF